MPKEELTIKLDRLSKILTAVSLKKTFSKIIIHRMASTLMAEGVKIWEASSLFFRTSLERHSQVKGKGRERNPKPKGKT